MSEAYWLKLIAFMVLILGGSILLVKSKFRKYSKQKKRAILPEYDLWTLTFLRIF